MKLTLVNHHDFDFKNWNSCRIDGIGPRHVEIADALVELMLDNGLRALSAPQAGIRERIMVANWAKDGEAPDPLRMFNPEVEEYNAWLTPDRIGWETCVSLPGVRKWVRRRGDVEIHFQDAGGKGIYYCFSNDDVPPVMRALDYLNGNTIMDRIVHTSPRLRPHEGRQAWGSFCVSNALDRDGWVLIRYDAGNVSDGIARMNLETGDVVISENAEALTMMVRDIVRLAALEFELTEEEKDRMRMFP